ncbi:efflux RND transporter periplasmic adaptor subunit [Methylocystis heyeri]|uniref:Efflux RND transporter periplasmic adaptor subunit n=1 Tax=Methylocystis heyeri TaxID=391905 RepID=A0A6B8K8J5_9HYPH|nr:efflux RND transporter periplasmic adaptor subunit [Methylocystis heyeri]QGM44336.1 efflux RND transporter periplasmic adaptor subunit [Methylocystis heyeri]
MDSLHGGYTRSDERRTGPLASWSRKLLIPAAIAASLLAGSWFPQISAPLRSLFSSRAVAPSAQDAEKQVEGHIKLSPEQISAAGVETARVAGGALTKRMTVPALVSSDPDRVGRVAAKVAGTVAELRKKLGDMVQKDEVVAILDSREVADAKSEYLAALVNYNLQNELFQREKGLFEKKITAEQLFLRARTTFSEAKLRLDVARQKLAALDLSENEIATLPRQPVAELRRKEIRAPVAGAVVERRVNLGQPVGGEGQEKELFRLADLSVVEAELSVGQADLANIKENQPVRIVTADGAGHDGLVTYSPRVLDQGTQSGSVLASFDNADGVLRPGAMLTAKIDLAKARVRMAVPRAAIQTIDGEPSVFIRVPDGFVRRKVDLGASDDESTEIISGIEPGETIAVGGTFALKAELGKSSIDTGD